MESEQLSCGLLVRDDLETIMALVIGEHDGNAIGKRQVFPGDGRAFAALVGPGRANAGPDFLAAFCFARSFAVVEDMRWCVCHISIA